MKKLIFTLALTLCLSPLADAKPGANAPDKAKNEGQGPFPKLILRGLTLINGEGAPPRGPVDIVIEGNRISEIVSVGNPGVPVLDTGRPEASADDKELDLSGHYALPGFIDMHGHVGGSADDIPAEYVFKLWLAHGITTVREPGSFNGVDWVMDHVKRSQKNQIVAPRIVPYFGFGLGSEASIHTEQQARAWIDWAAKQGAKGVKFFGASPDVMKAALEQTHKRGLGSAMHHAQLNVMGTNALDSARLGLTTMEHWYGLPEALFEDKVLQDYPSHYNYNDEQHRFAEAGRLWQQAAKPGTEKWNKVRDELIALNFTLDPTLTIYEASRDLMREQQAIWHQDYTLPTLWDFFQPNRYAHGSYWFDWTTADEIAWKDNYRLWMQFLNDYKNHGGRVTTGSDSGYIYKIYGFGYIRELELLQEAGFHPLEVIQAATLNGAQALGMDTQIGSVSVGKLADIVIVEENPLANFKVLYGTGHFKLGEDNKPTRVGGVKYTIKDGIVYDAKALLKDVREIVSEAKTSR
ncbi:amidohydrolase family protein [Aliiglaciecola sp. CAU 1673]|uniref:amidohydrolase family protein n=1 Tax=Aliiglaciecola sp. CAU 1673 TaxID=3032595 RepID=UPI0023D9FFB9|nr:amidohydrolase family protein [Aliiglaciecola sp. CAU 1673]MDF2177254.1 amidohydrolase family protein [Aliiglaciecola sp. CAU 1673]